MTWAFSRKIPVMSQYLVDRGFAALSLITTLLLCDCSSPKLAVEGNPMPEKQVATYMTSVTPSSAYDTPPKFLKGYAPFFPGRESDRKSTRLNSSHITISYAVFCLKKKTK